MGRQMRPNDEHATVKWDRCGDRLVKKEARHGEQIPLQDALAHVTSGRGANSSTEGASPGLRILAVAAMENALAVAAGNKVFSQAVTCIGDCAIAGGLGGATVNSAMKVASETLVLAGCKEAAGFMPLLAKRVIAFLLLQTILPGIVNHAKEQRQRNSAPSPTFIPASLVAGSP